MKDSVIVSQCQSIRKAVSKCHRVKVFTLTLHYGGVMAYFLSVLGLVLVIEGLPYFAFPARVKEWALTLQEIPERPLRVMGLVSMLAGLLLVYISRRVF